MKLYEFYTTEQNGEQEYTESHLVRARDMKEARKLAIEYCKKSYDVEDDDEIEVGECNGSLRFSFFNDEIIIGLGDIIETTIADWQQKILDQTLIN